METKRYELADSKWNRIKDMLPPEQPKSGKRRRPAKYDNRCIMNDKLDASFLAFVYVDAIVILLK